MRLGLVAALFQEVGGAGLLIGHCAKPSALGAFSSLACRRGGELLADRRWRGARLLEPVWPPVWGGWRRPGQPGLLPAPLFRGRGAQTSTLPSLPIALSISS